MQENNKFWLKLWAIIAAAVTIIIISAFTYDYQKDVRMAELGFQKVGVIGNVGTFYQKADAKPEPERKPLDRYLPNEPISRN